MFRLPNAITISRILLVPFFVIAFALPGDTARLVAFVIFCIAGLSDALDGLAARKLNAGSDFGRMLDPIADKVLVAVALMMLVAEGNVQQFHEFNIDPNLRSLLRLVPALVILAREILVSGLREFLAETRVKIRVTAVAKLKTTIQMIAIGAMILGPIADQYIPGAAYFAYTALWVAAGLTVYTGVVYFNAGLAYLQPARAPEAGSSVTLLYFAWVRQKIGRSEETMPLPPGVKTVADLVAHLKQLGGGYADAFADPARMRVAVNQDHCDFDTVLSDNDEVAFFPPVTGG